MTEKSNTMAFKYAQMIGVFQDKYLQRFFEIMSDDRKIAFLQIHCRSAADNAYDHVTDKLIVS